jgi:hypothetical protein
MAYTSGMAVWQSDWALGFCCVLFYLGQSQSLLLEANSNNQKLGGLGLGMGCGVGVGVCLLPAVCA